MKLSKSIMIAFMVLCISGVANAQVIRPGVTYHGGDQLELPGSGANFIVPKGWTGEYNQQEKQFDMTSENGSITVGYDGKSYAETLADAQKPTTTSEGVVMTPILNKAKKINGKLENILLPYTGKLLGFMDVSAAAWIIKMPSGKALTISSSGLGNNLDGFAAQIGLVAPSLKFTQQKNSTPNRSSLKNKLALIPGNPDWRTALKGKKYYYIKGNGYGGFYRRTIMLCEDGTFWDSSAHSTYSTGGAGTLSYNSQNPDNEGRWVAYNTKEKYKDGTTKGTLILNYFNGSQSKYVLGSDSGGVLFNQIFYGFKGNVSGSCLD